MIEKKIENSPLTSFLYKFRTHTFDCFSYRYNFNDFLQHIYNIVVKIYL